uniref:Glucokinase n=1 Tax=Panagrolaimus davidi TaxID=227884 RepID=A0A914Q7B8_9BILA
MLDTVKNQENAMIFAGIEGGATHSKLIFIKIIENGNIERIFEEEGQSLNCVIQGADFTCDYIAKWIQTSAQKLELNLPIEGVGLGLAGAGNTQITQKINEIFITKYSNITKKCFVTTDAIAAIATAFKNDAEQDPLCKHLFEQAGEALAQKLIAVSRNFDNEMFQNVSVLLVGSVFQSWNILKFGFVKTLQTKPSKIKQLSFYKLKENAALGAAIFVLKNSEIFFDFDFNTTEFIDSIVISVV